MNSGYQWSLAFRLVIEKVPLLALSVISIYLSSLSVQRFGVVVSTETVPMGLRIANALVSYAGYIGKMVWPHNPAVFYPPHLYKLSFELTICKDKSIIQL